MKTCTKCHMSETTAGQSYCQSCKKEYDKVNAERKYKLRKQKEYEKNPEFKCPKCFKKVFSNKDTVREKHCKKCGTFVELDDANKHKYGIEVNFKVYKDKTSERLTIDQLRENQKRKRNAEERRRYEEECQLTKFDEYGFTKEQTSQLLDLDLKRKAITKNKSLSKLEKRDKRKTITDQMKRLKKLYNDTK